mgnify:CR=1 FL=1
MAKSHLLKVTELEVGKLYSRKGTPAVAMDWFIGFGRVLKYDDDFLVLRITPYFSCPEEFEAELLRLEILTATPNPVFASFCLNRKSEHFTRSSLGVNDL